MGAYLSSPIVDKISTDDKSDLLSYGASSMQGWRVSQEDAHNCIIDFDTETSLFAVYDGHGGPEVAKYCSLNLPDYLRSVTDYKEGNINKALEETFLQFDSTLTKPEVVADLKRFADIQSDSSADESENDTRMLNEEADMPLEEVLARYSGVVPDTETSDAVDADCSAASASSSSKPGSSKKLTSHVTRYHDQKPKSPMLHAKKSCKTTNSSLPCEIKEKNSNQISPVENNSSKTESVNDVKNDNAVASSETDNEAKADLQENRGNSLNGVSSSEVLSSTNLCSKDNHPEADGCNSVDSSDFAKPENKQSSKIPALNSKTDIETGEDGVSSTTLNGESAKKSDAEDESGQPSCSSTVSSSSTSSSVKKKEVSSSWVSSNEIVSSSDEEESEEDEDYEGADSGSSDGKLDDDDTTDDEIDDLDENDDDDMGMSITDQEKPGQDSGCTAVVALLRGSELYVANAGDSRCVLCREGKAVDMSFDHKPEDDVERERIVKAGGKVTCEGRVNGGLNLSRAIGDHVYKSNLILPLRDQMITALPDIQQITIDLVKDDFMILACDGIWNSMSSQEVVDFIKERLDKAEKLSQICEQLFDHCLAPNTDGDGTGCDNMTAIIVKFNKLGEAEEITKKRPAQENESAESESKKTKIEET